MVIGRDHEEQREDAVRRSGLLTRQVDPALTKIVASTAAYYRCSFAALSIITGQRQVLIASVGTDIVETPRDQSFCATTIQKPGELLLVHDATADERFSSLDAVRGSPFIRFYAGIAIVDQSGFPLGALCIADQARPRTLFDPTDLMVRAREVERLLRW